LHDAKIAHAHHLVAPFANVVVIVALKESPES
jgi:hypothetical protein